MAKEIQKNRTLSLLSFGKIALSTTPHKQTINQKWKKIIANFN